MILVEYLHLRVMRYNFPPIIIRVRFTILGIVTMLLFSIGCTKNPVETPIDKSFPVEFIFINKGDTTLRSLFLESSFYDIESDISFLSNGIYSPQDQDTSQILRDTIRFRAYVGSPGCKKAFQVTLYWDNIDSTKSYSYMKFRSNVYPHGDTIMDASEGIETFVWPDDSAKYTLLKYNCCKK